MKRTGAAIAAVMLASSITYAAPALAEADDTTGTTCEATGDAYCVIAACDEVAASAVRQLARAEKRLAKKNATIRRLRAQLAAQR
jgi:uncharacterized protein (DUF2147 family)